MSTETSRNPMIPARLVASSGAGTTHIEEREIPPPGPGEMRLTLRSCGLCGTDLFKITNNTVKPGTVLGHEIVGIVESLGDGVTGFSPGDRVVVPHHVSCGVCAQCRRGSETLCSVFRENLLSPGGFSEVVLVRERAVRLAARRLPDGVSDEAAVFLEPASCVLRGVWKAGIPSEEGSGPVPATAVVVGAGSMGLLHLLVLRAVHPHLRVLVSDTRADRLELALRLGAARAEAPGADGIGAAVREESSGLGVDAVFDTVGGAGLLDAALSMTREGGTVVLFAHAPDGERARFDLNSFFKNERRVLGTYSGGLREQEEIFRLITTGRLDASPLVTHRLPFERFDEGVRLCRDLQALKILMVPSSPEVA